jgi:hypothetical protein
VRSDFIKLLCKSRFFFILFWRYKGLKTQGLALARQPSTNWATPATLFVFIFRIQLVNPSIYDSQVAAVTVSCFLLIEMGFFAVSPDWS